MPRKFTEMLTDNAYKVRNRRDVKRFYQEVRDAVAAGTLGLDGHTLPTTMNAFIERVEGKPGALSNDYDVVDFSLADNGKLKRWRQTYLLKDKQVNVSAEARELFERVKELAAANERSMGSTNGKKDDLLTAPFRPPSRRRPAAAELRPAPRGLQAARSGAEADAG